jgi:hypothetical protein
VGSGQFAAFSTVKRDEILERVITPFALFGLYHKKITLTVDTP